MFFPVAPLNFWLKSIPELPGNLTDHLGPVWNQQKAPPQMEILMIVDKGLTPSSLILV